MFTLVPPFMVSMLLNDWRDFSEFPGGGNENLFEISFAEAMEIIS
jgi:hypothetical protein